jgi:hypothetical protein
MTANDSLHAEQLPEVMPATPRGRWLAALVVLFCVGLIILFRWFALPYFDAIVNATTAPPSPDAIYIVKCIFFGLAALNALATAVLIAYARKILLSRQYPPPGAWLWRDTRIVRGNKAVRNAWLYIAAGTAACVACLGLALYIAIMLDRLAPQFKLPAGVTIVQQRSFIER